MLHLVGFDIETHKITPSDEKDILKYMPLGISVGATTIYPSPSELFDATIGSGTLIWCAAEINPFSHIPAKGKLSKDSCLRLLRYLTQSQIQGYKIVTWNGNFDFRVLAEETGEYEKCAKLYLDSIDLMFQFFCIKGYFLAMNTAAKGMGLSGKTEGMHGDLAPVMWQGTVEDRNKVIEYVKQDVQTTIDLALAIREKGYIEWISQSGKRNTCLIQDIMTVKDAYDHIPRPDTSWMTNPVSREKFLDWSIERLI